MRLVAKGLVVNHLSFLLNGILDFVNELIYSNSLYNYNIMQNIKYLNVFWFERNVFSISQ